MINRDYILRLAEQVGRELSIIMGLRKRNKNEEALIAIDNLIFHKTGLTLGFIRSLSETMLIQALSPLGHLNVETCLWCAVLLKAEGEIYAAMGKENESYYSYIKALYLFLSAYQSEHLPEESSFPLAVKELQDRLAAYELPPHIQLKIFQHNEQIGLYAQAENILFEQLEQAQQDRAELLEQGRAFYERLQKKSDTDLLAGNLSREEVNEGLAQIQRIATKNQEE